MPTAPQLENEVLALRKRVAELQSILERSQRRALQRNDLGSLFPSVLEHAPVILWAVDQDGRFTESCGKGLETLGLRQGEAIGQSVYEMYGDFPQVIQRIRRALAGEEFEETTELDGLFFEGWFAPLFSADGDVCGAQGVATVVTERVQAQSALEESEERFSSASRSSPTGTIMTRLDDGCFIDVNDAFLRMTGYSRDDLIGRTAAELNCWVDPSQREELINELKQTGKRDDSYDSRVPAEAEGQPYRSRHQ